MFLKARSKKKKKVIMGADALTEKQSVHFIEVKDNLNRISKLYIAQTN